MGSYYLMFAHRIKNITPAEHEWWQAKLTALWDDEWDENEDENVEDVIFDLRYEWERSGDLAIWNSENIDLDALAELVQKFLKAHRPDGEEEISYASYGDEGEVDTFHGGFVYVNAKHIIFSDELRKYIGEEIDVREEMDSNG